MISYNTLAAYEKAIHKRFPFVTVISDPHPADEYDESLCAFGVPAERQTEFLDFLADELAPAFDAQGIEIMAVMPYSQEEAEELFPEAKKALLV